MHIWQEFISTEPSPYPLRVTGYSRKWQVLFSAVTEGQEPCKEIPEELYSMDVILILTTRGHPVATSWTGTLAMRQLRRDDIFKNFRYMMILSLVNQTVCSKPQGSLEILCGEFHLFLMNYERKHRQRRGLQNKAC